MLLTIGIFLVILIVLILVHELGHFVAAKWMGIRVEEFGIGYPPRAWGKKIGETVYSINWIPAGGFVRLYGEDEHHPEEVTRDKSSAFFAKKPWQRAIVLTAGVAMNVLLGWLLISFVLTQGVLVPVEDVRIEEVAAGSPAEGAELQPNDIIRKFTVEDGKEYEIKSTTDLIDATQDHVGETVLLTINRGDQTLTVSIIPREEYPEDQGPIGVVVSNMIEKRYSLFEAPMVGLSHVIDMIRQLVTGVGGMLWRLVTFQRQQVDVTGPVGIGRLVGQARSFGAIAVFELMAILSVNLAVLNILPFPALDGGRLFFVVIEGLTGRRVKAQWESYVHQIGMAILLLLLFLITINDIVRLVQG